MKISLLVPEVNFHPTDRPRACPHCKKAVLHRHGTVLKPIKDHGVSEVQAHRYKCLSCKRTFRHYPGGVTGKDQSQRTVVLAALMYGLGLSCSAASHLLGALGARVSKGTVWRDAQEAGEALRKSRPASTGVRARVLGADETVFKVKGREVMVGFVVDAASGRTLGFEVLVESDGETFREWLKPYAKELGAEILVTDDNDSYSVAASGLGLSHQLCMAHVRKYVKRRSKSILEQAKREWGEEDPEKKLGELEADLVRVRELVDELGEEGDTQMGRLHRGYSWASPPERKGEKASAAYRMRMLALELWNKWPKLLLHLRRPELGMDGTNNASERVIGRSKVRYKTMRGYKSPGGMKNGIGLTQWLYSGEDEHDLAEEMAA
ncbi:MAG: transposase [Actinomycetota bacterium]|nr:transposase [Actinomycetota bacterium]